MHPLGVVAYTFNTMQRLVDQFEANLVYEVSSRALKNKNSSPE